MMLMSNERNVLEEMLKADDALRAQHESTMQAPPLTDAQLADVVGVAKLVMAGALRPSPFMTMSFAKALAQLSDVQDALVPCVQDALVPCVHGRPGGHLCPHCMGIT